MTATTAATRKTATRKPAPKSLAGPETAAQLADADLALVHELPADPKAAAKSVGLPLGSFTYFIALADDAPNWGGRPWFDGNVAAGPSTSGWVNRLVKAELIVSHHDDDRHASYAQFTRKGVELAAKLGLDLTNDYPEHAEGVVVAKHVYAEPQLATQPAKSTPASTSKPAKSQPVKATSAPRASKIEKVLPKLPEGYALKWPHGGYDLYKRGVEAGETGAKWFVVCNVHGTHKAVESPREGDALGTRAGRPTWCTKCAASPMAPVVAAAAPVEPVKSTPAKRTARKSTSTKR